MWTVDFLTVKERMVDSYGMRQENHAQDPLEAELMVLQQRLHALSERNYYRVFVEIDSSQSVHLLHGDISQIHLYIHSILRCKQLHCRLWSSSVVYIPRTANNAAHSMSRMASSFCTYKI